MLSRVADCLFWMSRYIERADNCARMLNVNVQLLLDCQGFDDRGLQEHWEPILSSLGNRELFYQLYTRPDLFQVSDFVSFDEKNPNSIAACLCYGRENARMVRGEISSEMWEELNSLYLYIRSKNARKDCKSNPYDFYNKVIRASHLFQGLTDSTLVRDEGWEFIQIGKYLERADQTTRMLDVRADSVHRFEQGGAVDVVRWASVLRSCSAQEAYHQVYVDTVEPRKVSEFLMLSDHFPRSIRFCLTMLLESLGRLSGVGDSHSSADAKKFAVQLLRELDDDGIENIFRSGLRKYLDETQIKLISFGDILHKSYFFYQENTSSQSQEQDSSSSPAA